MIAATRARILVSRSARAFSNATTPLIKKSKLPPRPKWQESMETDCTESFMHGGRGPGGQKINKCNSKVQLKHLPTGIVVECQATRSREHNRKIAREKMALEIERLVNGKEVGTETLTEREIALRQWTRQQKKSKGNKSRLKYEKHKEEQLLEEQREQELIKQLFGNPSS